MTFGSPDFVLAIIAISTAGWLVNNWIRARHGYALEDEWGGKTHAADVDLQGRLQTENADLREQLAHFADRIAVLERIATDANSAGGHQTKALAAEIESLRDR